MTLDAPARPDGDARAADDEALDAYSAVVSGVARKLAPAVSSLRVEGRGTGPVGAGSGVVVSPDGLLVTSAHVVRRAAGGTATFTDGSERAFDVSGVDALSDLAVVRVRVPSDEPSLPAASLGDAERLVVGQLVVAVGNPLGFAGSVSAGVVSGLGRSLATTSGSTSRVVDDVIQTDAALHPGNSGGALADSRARVVGINTAVVGPWIGQGLGLAVPINAATRQIIATLVQGGKVRRAYLGIGGGARPLPPSVGRGTRNAGVEVTSVVAESPAGRAGVRAGDVLVAVEGQPVESVGELQALMTEGRIGRPTTVTVWREGRMKELLVAPGELEG